MAIPNASQALSCIDPASSLEQYLSSDSVIFTATAGEVTEFISKSADESHSRMYDSGYTGQVVEVREVHKGNVNSSQWVYFLKDENWGYLCTNQPPEAGTENVYIVSSANANFDLPTVVQVFAVDSEYAEDLLANIKPGQGYLNKQTAATWREQLGRNLRQMVFILRIKLHEWRYWASE